MVRPQPGRAPAANFPSRPLIADLELAVVTPMFGGGAAPGGADDDWPIRPAAIRGHLRFWWRACNARSSATAADLFAKEAKLWGTMPKGSGTSLGPSPIEIRVAVLSEGKKSFYFHGDRDIRYRFRGWHTGQEADLEHRLPRGPDYALFPFTGFGNDEEGNPRIQQEGREDVRFRLQLLAAPHITATSRPSLDELKRAAQQALWAWITFGGVGARTRRGCGTLRCVRDQSSPGDSRHQLSAGLFQPPADGLDDWLTDNAKALIAAGTGPRTVPSLAGASFIHGQDLIDDFILAWHDAVEPMFLFRQGNGIGRVPRSPIPSESYWPEAGALRQLLGITDPRHWCPTTADGRDFPRADLGLPIVFMQMGEPTPRLEANHADASRMASPIILKALPVSDKTAFSLILVLDAPHIWDLPPAKPNQHLNLTRGGASVPLDASLLDDATQRWRTPGWRAGVGTPPWSHPKDSPPMGTKASARDAFTDFVKERNGWTEWRTLL